MSEQPLSDAQIEKLSNAVIEQMSATLREQVAFKIGDVRREMAEEIAEIRDETKRFRDELTKQERKFLAQLKELRELSTQNSEAVGQLKAISQQIAAANSHMANTIDLWNEIHRTNNAEMRDARAEVNQARTDAAYARANSEDILNRTGTLDASLRNEHTLLRHEIEGVQRVNLELQQRQKVLDEYVKQVNQDIRPVANTIRWIQSRTETSKGKAAAGLGGLTIFLAGTYQIWQDFISLIFGG